MRNTSTSLLPARIAALSLTEHQGDILQAVDGFIVEGGLNIRQLKLHARHTRNRLAAAGIAVKLNHALELYRQATLAMAQIKMAITRRQRDTK